MGAVPRFFYAVPLGIRPALAAASSSLSLPRRSRGAQIRRFPPAFWGTRPGPGFWSLKREGPGFVGSFRFRGSIGSISFSFSFLILDPPKVAVSMDIRNNLQLLQGEFSDPCPSWGLRTMKLLFIACWRQRKHLLRGSTQRMEGQTNHPLIFAIL